MPVATLFICFARYTGCCWSPAGNIDWEIRVKGNTVPRPDTGLINSSPVTTAIPLRLQAGCSHTIRIPVRDADSDIVRCRWAVWTEECSDACYGLPGALLNQVHAPLIISSEVFVIVTKRLQNTDITMHPLSRIPVSLLGQHQILLELTVWLFKLRTSGHHRKAYP